MDQEVETTELETQVEEEFASRQEPEPEPTPEPEPEPVEEEAPVEEDPEAAEVEQAKRLYAYFQSRPDMAQALVDLEQGRATVAPVQVEAPKPEVQEDDFNFWNDPEATVKSLAEKQRNFESYIQQQTYSNNLGAIQTGKEMFARNHPDLKPDEVEFVADALAKRNIMRSYWERNPNYVGVTQAMEDVYRAEFFDRSRTAVAKDLTKASAQRRRAASVGTSRASAPRTDPIPTDPKEKRQAMVREIEEWINNS